MPLTSTTKRTLIIVVILASLVTVAGTGYYIYRGHGLSPETSAGEAPAILTELPADAPVVAYIDMAALRKLQNSPLSAMLGLAGASPAEDRDYARFVSDTGFNYARDLNTVAVGLWPADLDPASKGLGENRVLAIADGRFDEQKIKAYALRTGKVVMRDNGAIYEVPGDPAISFEFLSPTRIALASGKNADELADVPASHQDAAAIRARTEHVASAPIFAVASTSNLPVSFYTIFHNLAQLERLVRSVHSLTLAGLPDGEQIQATLDAQCDSTKNALELTTLLDGARILGSVALSDPKTRRQMTKQQAAFLTALINTAKVSHEDTWVRLKLAITPEMLGATPVAASTPAPSSTQ